jgi:hypothetical protein
VSHLTRLGTREVAPSFCFGGRQTQAQTPGGRPLAPRQDTPSGAGSIFGVLPLLRPFAA